MLIVCWRSISPSTILRRINFTEFYFSVSIKFFKFSKCDLIFFNEGSTPLAGTFLRFCSLQHLFFRLENNPYLLCALFHANTLTHNRIFEHKGIDALLPRFNFLCELIDKWMSENILLDGSLSSCFIYQDTRLEIWNCILKLGMTHSLKNG